MRQSTAKGLVVAFGCLIAFGAILLVVGLALQLRPPSFVHEVIARLLVPLGASLVTAGVIGFLNVGGIREELKRLDPYFRAFEETKAFVVTQVHKILDVYAKRSDALEAIARSLQQEGEKVEVVGSSLKGLIGIPHSVDPGFELSREQRIVCEALRNRKPGCCCQVLLTHPSLAFLRARQERRQAGAIEEEILGNLKRLVEEFSIPLQQIRLYKGTPTAFCVITTERMWLNPYPYEETSMDSFCMELGPGPIYSFYRRQHFLEAWAGPNAVRFSPDLGVDQAIADLRQLLAQPVQEQFRMLGLSQESGVQVS